MNTAKDELFDDELRKMVRFVDATDDAQIAVESEKKTDDKRHVKEKKTPQNATSEPMDAEYEPVSTWCDNKTVKCAKWFLLFAVLEYLLFYWMQTGQMAETAAMPSIIVCALLAGISVGKNWKWRS